MNRKRLWTRIFIAFAWVSSLAGMVVLMSFIEVKKAHVICKDVKIYIPGNQFFIDKQEVNNILELDSHTLVGRRVEGINIHDLEKKLQSNPFIESAKVFTDMDGIIRVEISQRQPILRVMNKFDQDFYIDQHGLKIPLSTNFTARVLAANGNIDEPFGNKVDTLKSDVAKELFRAADFIAKDSLWDAQIGQMYVNDSKEIELIPRVGSQRILLGHADSLATRFNNLLAFYKQALPKVGWDKYKIINIKYANQIVGVKNQLTKADSLKLKAQRDSIKSAKDTSQIQH